MKRRTKAEPHRPVFAPGSGIGLGIPLLPVSTLATLAQVSLDRHDHANTLVALDARMNEIYWAVYERDQAGCARQFTGTHAQ